MTLLVATPMSPIWKGLPAACSARACAARAPPMASGFPATVKPPNATVCPWRIMAAASVAVRLGKGNLTPTSAEDHNTSDRWWYRSAFWSGRRGPEIRRLLASRLDNRLHAESLRHGLGLLRCVTPITLLL